MIHNYSCLYSKYYIFVTIYYKLIDLLNFNDFDCSI